MYAHGYVEWRNNFKTINCSFSHPAKAPARGEHLISLIVIVCFTCELFRCIEKKNITINMCHKMKDLDDEPHRFVRPKMFSCVHGVDHYAIGLSLRQTDEKYPTYVVASYLLSGNSTKM